MYWIRKEVSSFDYGHRVWSQELDDDLSCNSKCKCRWNHGHRGQVIVYVKADALENGMVIDFTNLKIIGKFLDDVVDHHFIIDRNDPIFNYEIMLPASSYMNAKTTSLLVDKGHYSIVDVDSMEDMPQHIREKLESYVVVNFTPTSENLAKWMYDISNDYFKDNDIDITGVEWWETPKSFASYYG